MCYLYLLILWFYLSTIKRKVKFNNKVNFNVTVWVLIAFNKYVYKADAHLCKDFGVIPDIMFHYPNLCVWCSCCSAKTTEVCPLMIIGVEQRVIRHLTRFDRVAQLLWSTSQLLQLTVCKQQRKLLLHHPFVRSTLSKAMRLYQNMQVRLSYYDQCAAIWRYN